MFGRRSFFRRLAIQSRSYSSRASEFQSTTLSNGIKVATSSHPGHFSATGLYVDAGSRYETDKLQGVSHIVDRLAFKSTQNTSGPDVLKSLELLGGNYLCASSRESLMYQASVFNTDIEKMFKIMSETVKIPNITLEELQEQKFTAQYEIDEIWLKPELILPELLHGAAYSGITLGSPLLCPADRLESMNQSLIHEYRNKFYGPESIVAAFVGIPHQQAIEFTEKYLGDMKQVYPRTKPEVAHYTGGEIAIPANPPIPGLPELVHIYIGFEGLSFDDPDVYALAVLQTLLGGGGSFSAGGPGKGMYSRLYTHVLNQYYYVEHCQSFNHSYTDSGLFGIQLSCIPQAAHVAAEIIAIELSQTFTKENGRLNQDEVNRSKNQLCSSLMMNLESKLVQLEDLGRQMQVRGHKVPVEDMVTKIQSLTVEDIRRVAERVLSGNANNKGNGTGKPTVVIQGPRENFGDINAILTKYGLGRDSKPLEKPKPKGWFTN